MTWFCLAGFVTLLLAAAVTDLRWRRIPNWLTAGLAALYPVYVLTAPAAVPWPSSLAAAAVVFLLGLVLFARRLLGGGDVKLITAATLWSGIAYLPLFAAVTSLAGGALALAYLFLRSWSGLVGAHLAALGIATGRAVRTAPTADTDPAAAAPAPKLDALPYGIAVAAGGLAVAVNLLTL